MAVEFFLKKACMSVGLLVGSHWLHNLWRGKGRHYYTHSRETSTTTASIPTTHPTDV